MQAELIVDARNAVGESPVWVPEENALYWVNIPNGGLQCWNATSGKIQGWEAPEMLACIARHQDGGWVAGMESGFFRLHPHDDGSLDSELCASVEHSRADMRLNDGRCDRQGRFWAGSMVLNMGANADEGRMYRHEAGQRSPVEAQLSGFIVPNGLGFSPDGRLDRSLEVPVKKPTMCAFGGSQLDTLFVTSIRPGDDNDPQSLAGGVFALNPGVKGLAEPAFGGRKHSAN